MSVRRRSAAIFALHALVFAALTAWSWRTWPDPIIDFGRELYVPWQLTRGRLLYRDLASLFGPLSPYVNALWFELFGPSLLTLAMCNLAIAAAIFACVYHLLRVSTGVVAASAGTLAAMLLCGFSQYIDVGNYNLVTPYAHEATHGLALSVAALVALHRAVATRRTRWFAVAGLCVGLVFLTKPEVFLAIVVAIAVGVAAAWSDIGPLIGGGAVRFLAGAITAPTLSTLAFIGAGRMPAADALRATSNAWVVTLTTPIARTTFYLHLAGFDHPALNVVRLTITTVCAIAIFGATVAVTSIHPRSRVSSLLRTIAAAGLVVFAGYAGAAFDVMRALPVFTLGVLAIGVAELRSGGDRDSRIRWLPLVLCSAFAFAMLAKMILNARVIHYGFTLALPAVSVTVAALVGPVAERISRGLSSSALAARQLRTMAIALVAAAILPYLTLANLRRHDKTLAVGTYGDRFYALDTAAAWQGRAVRDAVAWIDTHAGHGSTIAVLPEGVMINYLSRREAPSKYVTVMPPEMLAFGEPAMLASFRAHPPDLVLIVPRNTTEYGYPSFGAEPAFGQQLLAWVKSRYEIAATVGPDFNSGRGIAILRRAQ